MRMVAVGGGTEAHKDEQGGWWSVWGGGRYLGAGSRRMLRRGSVWKEHGAVVHHSGSGPVDPSVAR